MKRVPWVENRGGNGGGRQGWYRGTWIGQGTAILTRRYRDQRDTRKEVCRDSKAMRTRQDV